MGLHYNHLSVWERQRMYVWYHYNKKSQREIARLLGRSHTTISREIKRNKSDHYVPTWYPSVGHTKYNVRIRNRGQRPRLKNDATRNYIIEKLKIGWTPEIIAGRLRIEPNLSYVCYESIYQYIYKEYCELIAFLPRKHKKRRKKYPKRSTKNKVKNKTSIENRSTDIDDRLIVGHWESDSIISSGQKPGCNVLLERVTRLVQISKLSSKNATDTSNAIINKLSNHPEEFVQSITYDNGSENAKHLITNDALSCDSFFCLPYHSWEKGSVEQINGLIRRFLPKGTDLTKVTNKMFEEIEHTLNSRPRKCLKFKTPYEVYEEYFGKTNIKNIPLTK